jgi:hypothetical protein
MKAEEFYEKVMDILKILNNGLPPNAPNTLSIPAFEDVGCTLVLSEDLQAELKEYVGLAFKKGV